MTLGRESGNAPSSNQLTVSERSAFRRKVDLKLPIALASWIWLAGVLWRPYRWWMDTETSWQWALLAAAFLVPVVAGGILWLLPQLQPRPRIAWQFLILGVLAMTAVTAPFIPSFIDAPVVRDTCGWDTCGHLWNRDLSLANWSVQWKAVPHFCLALIAEWVRTDGRLWLRRRKVERRA